MVGNLKYHESEAVGYNEFLRKRRDTNLSGFEEEEAEAQIISTNKKMLKR